MKSALTIILFIFLLILTAISSFAQPENFRIGGNDENEVAIAINHTNPFNIAGGANIRSAFYSFDAGKTWQKKNLNSPFGVWGDPSLIFDADGNLYFGHLANYQDGYWLDRMIVEKSTDGGISWSGGVGIGASRETQHDKEWITCDVTESEYYNRLYLSWTEFDWYSSTKPDDHSRILFSYSSDQGESWTTPLVVSDTVGSCVDGDDALEGAVSAVGPEGQVYVCWAAFEKIYFDKSTNGGVTFGKDKIIAEQPGGWWYDIPGLNRSNGLPVIKCDISNTPHRGTIYVNYSDQRNGEDDTDVFLIKSTDEGETWTEPMRVNKDTTKTQQFLCWMDVDPVTGFVYVIYYDRRNTTGNNTDVYVARSTDGARHFEEFKINESSFLPDANKFFGDYCNIAAYEGKVYPIYMRMDSLNVTAWTAPFDDSDLTDLVDKKYSGLKLYPAMPNPMSEIATVSFDLPHQAFAEIDVFDRLGRKVNIAGRAVFRKGRNYVTIDAGKFGNGIYYVSLMTEGKTLTTKCVVLR